MSEYTSERTVWIIVVALLLLAATLIESGQRDVAQEDEGHVAQCECEECEPCGAYYAEPCPTLDELEEMINLLRSQE